MKVVTLLATGLVTAGCVGKTLPEPAPPRPQDVAAGRRIYSRYCRSCHGRFELRSTPPEIGTKRAFLHRTVRDGVAGTAMFGYGKMLTDTELARVVDYLLSILDAAES